jgi:aspartate-semialdehyde dehydrogenase
MNPELTPLNVAVVGATGMVGRTMLSVLEARNFPVATLLPVASARSVGSTVTFRGEEVEVVSIEDALAQKPHVALFSAGGDLSLEWAPRFAEVGTTVVDNSSAWRMSEDHKLVVPEVNGEVIGDGDLVIANPNCTTMQLVMCLKPLHDRWKIERGVVNTYQSVTGTGQAAVAQLEAERRGEEGTGVYPHPIDKNCLPHCDTFQENGYTREEMKVHHETKKIMGDDRIQLSCTAVRVPVVGGHSEAVYVEFAKDYEMDAVREALAGFPGVVLEDSPEDLVYPMPRNAHGKDEVFVGRLRRDLGNPKGLHLWIVADNLRKGAATNTVQIAEHLHKAGRWS